MADPLDTKLPPRSRRFVGVFDVLGFKNFVANHSLDDVLATYAALQRESHEQTRWPIAKLYSGGGGRIDTERVPLVIGSDTLFLWQHGSGEEHIQNFFSTACLLVARSVRLGVPLRGGIAYGECVMDQDTDTFVGQPLIDAHLVEAVQEWAGVALHETCFTSPLGNKVLRLAEDVVEYEVPVKAQRDRRSWLRRWIPSCIDRPATSGTSDRLRWALSWHAWADADVDDQLARLEAAAGAGTSARAKIANTRKFCAAVPRE